MSNTASHDRLRAPASRPEVEEALETTQRVQFKRELAALGYPEQVDAVQPPLPLTTVQTLRVGEAAAPDAEAIRQTAALGMRGSASALPHLDRVQSAFGHHDVRGVNAFTGGEAAAANRAMGSVAYASGEAVAFQGAPDLKTVAHEAAHVVQQRAGVQLEGGVGKSGDTYERHADAVANRVASGQSASGLLDQMSGSSSTGAAVQHRVWVNSARSARDSAGGLLVVPPGLGGEPLAALMQGTDGQVALQQAWDTEIRPALCRVVGVDLTALDPAIEQRCHAKLLEWAQAATGRENVRGGVTAENAPAASSEERRYLNYDHLATALLHESAPEYEERLAVEGRLAQAVRDSTDYQTAFNNMLTAYGGMLSPAQLEELGMLAANSRYRQFTELTNATSILRSPGSADMGSKCILADEITKYAAANMTPQYEDFRRSVFTEHGRYRENGYTVSEDHPWVQAARALGTPLSAGPSDTTAKVLALGRTVGLGNNDLFKIAWCMFAFYNGMWRGYSATHRLHEVMAAAALYFDPTSEGYTHSITSLP